MLSVKYPGIRLSLQAFRYGLMPIFLGDVGSLVLKLPKEAILTAKSRNEVKLYLLSDGNNLSDHLGVITAFFDDHDEPLTITTLLFSGDDLLPNLTAVLSQAHFDIYFFDEHDREWMGVQAINADAERCQQELGSAKFPFFDIDTYRERANHLNELFSIREVSDDEAAFTFLLGKRLYPDDLSTIDARPQTHKSESTAARPAISTLIREDPGPQRERDIAALLGRAFPAQSIYLNPFRGDTGKELTDILVVTDQIMLLVEAKDSPNTLRSLGRSLERKRQSVQKHIEKAVKQLRGGLSHVLERRGVTIVLQNGQVEESLIGRQLLGLVVVSEMFDDRQFENSRPVLDLVKDVGTPVMLIDYAGLAAITSNLRTPEHLTDALHDLFDAGIEHGRFPRSVWHGPPSSDVDAK